MKLYVVIGGWLYETQEVIGVFDSREKAESAMKEEDRVGFFEYTDIEGMNLNERRTGGISDESAISSQMGTD